MTESGDAGVALADAIYKDATRSPEERTEDLLSRMTLEEKVAQMLCIWQQKPKTLVDEQGRFDRSLLDVATEPLEFFCAPNWKGPRPARNTLVDVTVLGDQRRYRVLTGRIERWAWEREAS